MDENPLPYFVVPSTKDSTVPAFGIIVQGYTNLHIVWEEYVSDADRLARAVTEKVGHLLQKLRGGIIGDGARHEVHTLITHALNELACEGRLIRNLFTNKWELHE